MVSATQAKFDNELEDMMRKALWVDITKGIELSEQVEYKQEARGHAATLLDPSNPDALNFAYKQFVKSLNTAATGGLLYTTDFLVLLGKTAYMPMEDYINSQESDIVERESDESKTEEEPKDVGVITNLTDITQFSTGKGKAYINDIAVDDKDNEDKVEVADNDIDMLQSPKVMRMATVH